MPLDAAGQSVLLDIRQPPLDTRQLTVEQTALMLGITPIPQFNLMAHKAEQVGLHPPSVWYEHWPSVEKTLTVTMLGGFVLGIVSGATWMADVTDGLPVAITFGVFMLSLITILFATVRGPAKWENVSVDLNSAEADVIPQVFRDMAADIARTKPDVRFVLGTLMQGRVHLDPYLLVQSTRNASDLAVLGIWDGDQIIQSATRT